MRGLLFFLGGGDKRIGGVLSEGFVLHEELRGFECGIAGRVAGVDGVVECGGTKAAAQSASLGRARVGRPHKASQSGHRIFTLDLQGYEGAAGDELHKWAEEFFAGVDGIETLGRGDVEPHLTHLHDVETLDQECVDDFALLACGHRIGLDYGKTSLSHTPSRGKNHTF